MKIYQSAAPGKAGPAEWAVTVVSDDSEDDAAEGGREGPAAPVNAQRELTIPLCTDGALMAASVLAPNADLQTLASSRPLSRASAFNPFPGRGTGERWGVCVGVALPEGAHIKVEAGLLPGALTVGDLEAASAEAGEGAGAGALESREEAGVEDVEHAMRRIVDERSLACAADVAGFAGAVAARLGRVRERRPSQWLQEEWASDADFEDYGGTGDVDESNDDMDDAVASHVARRSRHASAGAGAGAGAEVIAAGVSGLPLGIQIIPAGKGRYAGGRVCPVEGCGFATFWSKNLASHMRIVHGGGGLSTKDGEPQPGPEVRRLGDHHAPEVYSCPLPGCMFTTHYRNNIAPHMRTRHDPVSGGGRRRGSGRNARPKRVAEKKFACDFEGCVFITDNTWRLTNHKRIHSDKRPYKCSECPYAAKQLAGVHSHMKRKHNLLYTMKRANAYASESSGDEAPLVPAP